MTKQNKLGKNFFKDLFKYYMEFLESDFKSGRPPSRKIAIYDKKQIFTGIKLDNYSNLNKNALSLLHNKFKKNPFTNIKKGKYTLKFPKDIIEQIKEKKNQPNFSLSQVLQIVLDFLKKRNIPHKEKILNDLREKLKSGKIKNFQSLSKYIYLDFYDEFYELWKNKQVLDKQDFYLYFMKIRYKNNSYPIFYIPFEVERTIEGTFSVEFEPVFLINKKAIEYVSSNYAKERNKQWKIDLQSKRHIYLGEYEDKKEFLSHLQSIINEICNFFELESFNISDSDLVEIKNDKVKITNTCYFAISNKSDEALLNDYEELLNLASAGKETETLEIFKKLTTDYIFENPKAFESEIEEEYNSQSVSDKLTYTSPISLNKEQLQILKAIYTEGCDRIVVEGPPGTGKSHTITAIIYNALLKNQSVLMVSDKKEALDVVEEKITEVLNSCWNKKGDNFVQNPILRLGKKDNNYEKIFKQINYEKIKNRFRTYKIHKEQLGKEIERTLSKIRNKISDELKAALSIDFKKIKFLLSFEETYNSFWKEKIDQSELSQKKDIAKKLYELWEAMIQIRDTYSSFIQDYKINISSAASTAKELLGTLLSLEKDMKTVQTKIQNTSPGLLLTKDISEKKLLFLEESLKQIDVLRRPILGYLFTRKQLKDLENRFNEAFFLSEISSIRNKRKELKQELQLYKFFHRINEDWKNVGLNLFEILRIEGFENIIESLHKLAKCIEIFLNVVEEIPATCRNLKIDTLDTKTIFSNNLIDFREKDLKYLIRFFEEQAIVDSTINALSYNEFIKDRKTLEDGLVFKMSNILDESVINFRDNNKADAEQLRKDFRSKRKISKYYLEKLVKAFPSLIVGIRELGDFIPLESDIFDIVIIDEASQVSIAQAFPAILRGKKVVVLGDPKQYSNVKAHNASIETNKFLFNQVKEAYKESISELDFIEQDRVKNKVDNFNIKNSILEFMTNISNYHCSLKKHFRGYSEIIGYSNKTFYQNSLQVMKVRGKLIRDVIQFHFLNPNIEKENFKNTNQIEAEFIMDELQRLKDKNFEGSVGIITPFTNQQKLLSDYVYDSKNWQFYSENFKLKVMTFDSCQGDEKDVIYYSMVEKKDQDILKYIFPLNLYEGETDNIKSQRLNVGLSRARESIRFVLSKQPEEIRGEIGKALQFYKRTVENYAHEPAINEKLESPMEQYLYNLLVQTPFYTQNKKKIEIIPQFDIGKYIRQLDPLADVPKYRSDFLFIYNDDSGKIHTVILEYDGYEFHFKDTGFVDEQNFDKFYVEKDIERQKTIESYGYRFIRLNKFLLREDPIFYINKQLENYCKKKL